MPPSLILSVLNRKGGVSKTTTSVGLSRASVARDWSTIAVDADESGSLSSWSETASDLDDPLPFRVETLDGRPLVELVDGLEADFVVVDSPPESGTLSEAVTAVADFVLIPSRPSGADLDRTIEAFDYASALGKPAAILLTQTRPRSVIERQIRDQLAEDEIPVLRSKVPLLDPIARTFGTSAEELLFHHSRVLDELVELIEGGSSDGK